MAECICAIHQPNFLPWLGYFDKIKQADIFVFLDAVAYPKSGNSMGCWSNRVKIDIQGRPAWIRCPVRRKSGIQVIRDVQIDDDRPWRKKFLRTVELNYKHAANYAEVIPVITRIIEFQTDRLAEFNMNAIETIAAYLGLECQFVRQSELAARGSATNLLVSIAKDVGAGIYLAGGGAAGYQNDDLFATSNIGLMYQDFALRPYGDVEVWLPGLSIIDFMMKEGAAEQLVRPGD